MAGGHAGAFPRTERFGHIGSHDLWPYRHSRADLLRVCRQSQSLFVSRILLDTTVAIA